MPTTNEQRILIQDMVKKARNELKPFCDSTDEMTLNCGENIRVPMCLPKAAFTSSKHVGGHPGIGLRLSMAYFDEDESGQVDNIEVEKFREVAQTLVENSLNQYLNCGVVAALMISIVYDRAFELIEVPDDSPWHPETSQIFQRIAFVCVQMVLGVSLVTLLISTRMYMFLTVSMPTLEDRMWLIHKKEKLTVVLGGLMLLTILSFAAGLLFGALASLGELGLVALVPVLLAVAGWVGFDIPTVTDILIHQHGLAMKLLKPGRKEVATAAAQVGAA
jgi:hypothetical protein